MSEFKVEVVRIGKKAKHPQADNLEITSVYGKGGYPCIFRTGEFNEGDLAVYVPVDALMPPGNPAWEFLRPDWRIKAKRLCGIFSQGLLLPMSVLDRQFDLDVQRAGGNPASNASSLLRNFDWQEGDNVQSYLGIQKYEEDRHLYMSGDVMKSPSWFREYTDIEGWKYGANKYVLQDGEEVVLREKIHGANGRWAFDTQLWVGSREHARKEGGSIWWAAAQAHELAEKLKYYPNIILFGEVYGPKVQKLSYGVGDGVRIRAFDAYYVNQSRYMNHDEFEDFCQLHIGVETAPILYRGPWSQELLKLAEEKSVVAPGQISEGFVVKPVIERWDERVKGGRVIFKVISEAYHMWKAKRA
jgi:RNA ligase (TIGR02306 family)